MKFNHLEIYILQTEIPNLTKIVLPDWSLPRGQNEIIKKTIR